jgi:hypothetical protein
LSLVDTSNDQPAPVWISPGADSIGQLGSVIFGDCSLYRGQVASAGAIRGGLPQGVAEDAISAALENGVLSITVPKPEQPKPKRIEISGEMTPSKTIEANESRTAAAV